jgi:hypothetical protein
MEMEIYGILHGDYICNVRCQQQGGRKILILAWFFRKSKLNKVYWFPVCLLGWTRGGIRGICSLFPVKTKSPPKVLTHASVAPASSTDREAGNHA